MTALGAGAAHDGTTHVCGLTLSGGDYPESWTTCKEADWQQLGDDADTVAYFEYVEAGGSREFEDWRGARCTTCSGRHESAEDRRPVFGVVPIPVGSTVLIINLYDRGRSSQVSEPDVPTVDVP